SGIPGLRGRLGLVSSPDNPSRHAAAAHMSLFAPRLGFAYRVTNRTVIRSGYGIFFVQNDGTGGAQLTSVTQSWVPTVDAELTPASTLSNPFPTGLLQPPQRNPNYQTLLLGTGISAPIPERRRNISAICSSGTSTSSANFLVAWSWRSRTPGRRA